MMGRAVPIAAGLAVLGLGALGLYAWRVGGISNVASSLAGGAVNAAGGAVSGAVGAVSEAVGLPTPAQTVTDASTARWLIDNVGHMEASKWSGAPAYIKALMLPSGSGTAPDPRSDAGRQFLGAAGIPVGRAVLAADYDETDRLVRRYPGPPSLGPDSVFNGYTSFGSLAGIDGGGFDGTPTSLYQP